MLGANLGSGLLAVLTTVKSTVEVRQVTVGNLVFKLHRRRHRDPFVGLYLRDVRPYVPDRATLVVLFHLAFNVVVAHRVHRAHRSSRRWSVGWLPKPDKRLVAGRPQHLDPSALSTPSLAISNAAREALHQADVVETMLIGMLDSDPQQRPAAGRGTAQARRRRSTSSTPPSSTT